jgi:uncharacterized membrane protein YkoI
MKHFLLALSAALLGGCVSISSDGIDNDREDARETISVPPKVLSAARARVPGFVLTEAELRDRDGIRVYELDGRAGGEDYELDVTPGGRVLRIDR